MSDKQEENTFLKQELEDSGLDFDHRESKNILRDKSTIRHFDDDSYEHKHRDE